jgi:hypothetical protein
MSIVFKKCIWSYRDQPLLKTLLVERGLEGGRTYFRLDVRGANLPMDVTMWVPAGDNPPQNSQKADQLLLWGLQQ